MPNAASRSATSTPIRPSPTIPTVLSSSSTPEYLLRFQAPPLSAWLAGAMFRAVASSRPTASSAAEVMLEVGALTTMTPATVAALTSTLSRPTPARATTFSREAAASASSSICVAERTRTASTSARAGSSSSRLAPSQCRTSKSGPRASRVAGESSSAIKTTGLVTDLSFTARGEGTRPRGGRAGAACVLLGTALCPLASLGTMPRALHGGPRCGPVIGPGTQPPRCGGTGAACTRRAAVSGRRCPRRSRCRRP